MNPSHVKSLIPDHLRQWPGHMAARAMTSLRRWVAMRRQNRALKPHLAPDRIALAEARAQFETSPDARQKSDPLVTVVIATWNRVTLLTERSVPSALAQTYRNIEVIVVGDCCTDDTSERLAQIRDPRLRFVNLPIRGPYPSNPKDLWCVAGAQAMNAGIGLARGDWIAHLDDDEIFEPDHVKCLLKAALKANAEFVCGQTQVEKRPGEWKVLAPRFDRMILSHSAVLFRTYLRIFKIDTNCWRHRMPGDQHTWQRMQQAGVRMITLNTIVGRAPLRPGNTVNTHDAEDRRTYTPDTPGSTLKKSRLQRNMDEGTV